jgi:hypothetical protein
MEPKYKVGDILQFNYNDGTVGTLRVDFIEYDEISAEEYVYCSGTKECYFVLLESDVIGVELIDEEEYQLYLKLKEKYEHI